MVFVQRWGYRQAFAQKIVLTLPRDLCDKLEEELAKQAKTTCDNHVTYKFIDSNGREWFVTISDMKCHFGTEVLVRGW